MDQVFFALFSCGHHISYCQVHSIHLNTVSFMALLKPKLSYSLLQYQCSNPDNVDTTDREEQEQNIAKHNPEHNHV